MNSKTSVAGGAILLVIALFAAVFSGCGGTANQATISPSSPPPSPPPSGTWSAGTYPAAYLSVESPPSNSWTTLQLEDARLRARAAHAVDRGAPVPAPQSANIYVWPTWMNGGWWSWAEPRRVTTAPGPYTAVYASTNELVFSAVVNGYNQIFFSKMPTGTAMIAPVQITADQEHHWLPHLSQDGKEVAFTKFDAASNGDVLCVMASSGNAAETCLDFSSTKPVLRGANLSHASWYHDGRIIFEAWGGAFGGDEIFAVDRDGSHLTQVSKNAGTAFHYESASYTGTCSLSPNGECIAVAVCDAAENCQVQVIDANGQSIMNYGPGWDPLNSPDTVVWVTAGPQLCFDMAWEPGCTQVTRSGSANFFASPTLR